MAAAVAASSQPGRTRRRCKRACASSPNTGMPSEIGVATNCASPVDASPARKKVANDSAAKFIAQPQRRSAARWPSIARAITNDSAASIALNSAIASCRVAGSRRWNGLMGSAGVAAGPHGAGASIDPRRGILVSGPKY